LGDWLARDKRGPHDVASFAPRLKLCKSSKSAVVGGASRMRSFADRISLFANFVKS
jgi:hypothetical protein